MSGDPMYPVRSSRLTSGQTAYFDYLAASYPNTPVLELQFRMVLPYSDLAVGRAIEQVVRRHEALRSTVRVAKLAPSFELTEETRPVQVVYDSSTLVIEIADMASLESFVRAQVESLRADPLATSNPPIRVTMRPAGAFGTELVLTVGHMFADAAGMRDLEQDIRDVLEGHESPDVVQPCDLAFEEDSTAWRERSEANLDQIRKTLERNSNSLVWASQPDWSSGEQFSLESTELAANMSAISAACRTSPATVVLAAIAHAEYTLAGQSATLIRSLFERRRPHGGRYLPPNNLNAFIEVETSPHSSLRERIADANMRALDSYARTDYDVTRLFEVQAAVAGQDEFDRFLLLNYVDMSRGHTSVKRHAVEKSAVRSTPASPYTYYFVDYVRYPDHDLLRISAPAGHGLEVSARGQCIGDTVCRWASSL